MGKNTNQAEKAAIAEMKRQKKELFKLLLKKCDITLQEFNDMAISDFVRSNLDLVTPSERKRFDKLVF